MLDVVGRGSVPEQAGAVWLNVTSTDAAAAGFVTVFSCASGLPSTSTLNSEPGATVANLAVVEPDGSGRVCIFASTATHIIVDATATTFGVEGLDILSPPRRLLDSRTDASIGRVSNFINVPFGDENIEVVIANVTVTGSDGPGYLTTCFDESSSFLNFDRGQTKAAFVVLPAYLGVCLSRSTAAHVIVDVLATASVGADLRAAPQRLADTRAPDALGPLSGGSTLVVSAVGRWPVPSDADAVMMVVAAVDPQDVGYATVYPCGEARPPTSNLNFGPGRNTSNTAIVPGGASGDVCIYISGTTHLVVDLTGYLTPDRARPQLIDDCGLQPVDRATFVSFQYGQPVATRYSAEFGIWGAGPFGLDGSLPAGFVFDGSQSIVWVGDDAAPADPPPPFQLTITDAHGARSTFPAIVLPGTDHLPRSC